MKNLKITLLGMGLILLALSVFTGIYAPENYWINLFISFLILLTGSIAAIFLHFDKKDFAIIKGMLVESPHQELDMDEFEDYFFHFHKHLLGGHKSSLLEKDITRIPNLYLRSAFSLLTNSNDVHSETTSLRINNSEYMYEQLNLHNVLLKIGQISMIWGLLGSVIGVFLKVGIYSTAPLLASDILALCLPTLYGIMLHVFLCKPLSDNILKCSNAELKKRETILSVVLGLRSQENPIILKERFGPFLNPKIFRVLNETNTSFHNHLQKKERLDDLLQDDMLEVMKLIGNKKKHN